MAEFAFRFPTSVFLELMSLPMDRVDEFLSWEKKLLHSDNLADIADGVRSIRDHLLGVIEERRRHPGEDFISIGLAARIEGRSLSADELMGFCFGLFVGGMDTVSTNMGLHFRHLAQNKAHQDRLRANPTEIPVALEELLRAYSAVTTFRTCIKPVQIAGVQIMPGDKVAMATTLANRDPEAFSQPNEVQLDRNPRQMTFGYGPHRCVGAPLARRELTTAMEEFLDDDSGVPLEGRRADRDIFGRHDSAGDAAAGLGIGDRAMAGDAPAESTDSDADPRIRMLSIRDSDPFPTPASS